MQINDLTNAESIVFITYFSHRVVGQFRILSFRIREGLKSIGLCLPRKRKFSNTVQFFPGILSIHLLTQFALLKQD